MTTPKSSRRKVAAPAPSPLIQAVEAARTLVGDDQGLATALGTLHGVSVDFGGSARFYHAVAIAALSSDLFDTWYAAFVAARATATDYRSTQGV